ncbi:MULTISPECIES: hypothetical protein [Hafnia]|uniref:hypothetical protein n=1 Tax=Hafnia TaxID=568 RepID=UPI001C03D232|nr:hypothetical protein [Hafnia paralvei]MBU2673549.1 hypothetical protein [Hafnia paralvei]
MFTKIITGIFVTGLCFSAYASSIDIDKKSDPASGFWECNGIRLHMGVNMATWTNLDNGDLYTITEGPDPIDPKDKDEKIKGMSYLFTSSINPAVVKYFIVDKTGKNLFIRDDIKFFKTYPCKRTK